MARRFSATVAPGRDTWPTVKGLRPLSTWRPTRTRPQSSNLLSHGGSKHAILMERTPALCVVSCVVTTLLRAVRAVSRFLFSTA
uniref:Uncharacterized protein n=1 Tax=Leersia perrieri TaxID=77586 RepID=A0A0D9X080_9ORYZ